MKINTTFSTKKRIKHERGENETDEQTMVHIHIRT